MATPAAAQARGAGLNRDEAMKVFAQAGLAYKQGLYSQASGLYQEILDNGWESGAIYSNLADSYFKQGVLGKAILNYERSRRILPRDSDLEASYRYALTLQKKFPQLAVPSPWQRFVEFVLQFFNLSELAVLGLILGLILGGLHLVGLFFEWPKQRRILCCGVAAMLLAIVIFGFVAKIERERDLAIILKDSAATFEPRDEATVYFELFAGNKVRIVKNSGAWVKIERPDGKAGWIKRDLLEKI
jgi:tetratricopeptide (TPR) repeat protein